MEAPFKQRSTEILLIEEHSVNNSPGCHLCYVTSIILLFAFFFLEKQNSNAVSLHLLCVNGTTNFLQTIRHCF